MGLAMYALDVADEPRLGKASSTEAQAERIVPDRHFCYSAHEDTNGCEVQALPIESLAILYSSNTILKNQMRLLIDVT